MEVNLQESELERLGDFVAAATGLEFAPSRWPELRRAIAAVASVLGFEDVSQCARRFISGSASKRQLDALASRLTVGETYFFREKRSFEILSEQILPPLIRARRAGRRYLRIWSAACCTGEEPYSIAILLRQLIPDIDEWNITLLASDINSRFLRKASRGVYGKWSFRSAPAGLAEQYFRPDPDGKLEILPGIKRMVRFLPANLVEESYPSELTGIHSMDIIFCRNVLMYFAAEQASKVLERLHRTLVEGGWLLVGPSEIAGVSSTPYDSVNFDGTILHRRQAAGSSSAIDWDAVPRRPKRFAPVDAVAQPANPSPPMEAKKESPAESPVVSLPEPSSLRVLARSLANQGNLAEALDRCDQSIAADQFNSTGHYLRAVILQELGAIEEAIHSLRGALYLDPDFVLAHFAMGNMARRRGDIIEARKHLENARKLLRAFGPDEVLPESDGVTAGRFSRIVESLIQTEAAA